MFGRRHAAPVQPLTKETANANAATAAASAFMRRASDASLSSAAAAAALRARPTSPTNVADVQSKRLSRRSPSVSSATGKRRELTRTPSVGSMMERTFRSPSPGRRPAQVPHDVPPIPRIPNDDNHKPSSRPTSSSRKGPQTQNFRTASERMRDGKGGSWFGAATAHDLHTVRRTTSELQLSSVRAPSDPRPGSVSPSINFSYPRARLRSPSGSLRSLQPEDQALVYDPNSRRMVSRAQLEAQSQDLYDEEYDRAVEKPQPNKRQPKARKEPRPAHISRAGSHLSRGTVGRTKAPALEAMNAAELQSPSSTMPEPDSGQEIDQVDTAPPKPKAKKKKKRKQLQSADSVAPESTSEERSGSSVPENTIAEKPLATTESSTVLPSAMEQAKAPSNSANGATPSPHRTSKVKAVAREPSESPARSARFAASATDQLVIRHEPPPRSLSPRKSALKHASPTRTVSPSDDGSDVSGVPGSLASPDDARKKSFRVSWDDRHTVVVGENPMQHAVEQAPSPNQQAKKTWHSIVGKGSKKEAISVEKEETMSPRPTLPSFGSVREKKPKEQEERRLVRPEHAVQTETSLTAATASTASPVEPSTSKPREPVMNVPSSVDKGEEYSSSEDALMEDTSDEDPDSGVEAAANGATRKINGSSGNQVPTIAVSRASPRPPQTEQLEKMAPIDVVDDDSSSGSEDLETIDPHLHGTGQPMDDIQEEEEGDMYSDAYEEIAEPDGDGFLSLDAVLESPTSSPNSKITSSKTAAEAREAAAAGSTNQSEPPDDWGNAKAYWKSLSSEKRRQLEREAIEEGEEGHQEDAKKVTAEAPKTTQPTTELTPTKERSYQIPPGTIQPYDNTPEATPTAQESKTNGSTMRKSMRGNQPSSPPKAETRKPGGSLRKSMRSEHLVSAGAESAPQRLAEPMNSPASPRMKRSLRHSSMDLTSSESRPSYSAADRPASYHAAVDSASSTRHTSSLRVNGSAAAAQGADMKATLRRRGSDSSESSFTRARAGSSGTHEFRRSMRGSMRQPLATSDGIRPLSPPTVGTRRDSISSLPSGTGFGGGRLRQSLRRESADPPARRRIPKFKKSTSGKSKKGKNDSRFGDSSDEDEGPLRMNLFKSRFADSSSEDGESHTKSKGKNIPISLRAKPNARAASSALDLPFDHDGRESPILDAAILMQPKRTQATTGQPGSGRGALVPLPQTDDSDKSFRPQHTRRGSFISLLRRKKDSSSKINRDLSESAARQDTKLERSPEELEALRSASLHKRGPSWPLPEPEATGAGSVQQSPERPSTAGGAIVSTSSNRSKFMRRRSASHGMVPADTVDMDDDLVTDAVPQKKKKFGALRKMFRLHD